jgi:hypothetical protein
MKAGSSKPPTLSVMDSTPTSETAIERASAASNPSSSEVAYDVEDHYVGGASGLSFLQEAVQHMESKDDPNAVVEVEYLSPVSASIFSSGDMPSPSQLGGIFCMPSKAESDRMLETYFEFATPTYRFFHRPTVESWASKLLTTAGKVHDQNISRTHDCVKMAAVYLVWAQAVEYEDGRHSGPKSR